MLSEGEKKYYDRHLRLPNFGLEAQSKLKNASVLVIGAGGLGVPVLNYLAAAGVGSITVIDDDRIDETNLHRQVLYSMDEVGEFKAQIAVNKISKQNPHIRIECIMDRLSKSNALKLVKKADVVVDCSDNFATRYLVNDACVIQNKPFVYGAIDQFSGQLSVFNLDDGPTYRCLFSEAPNAGEAPSCAEVGVLGVLPGLIGSYQALECIKVLTGIGQSLSGKLLWIDTLLNAQQTFKVPAVPTNKEIKTLGTYEALCGDDIPQILVEDYRRMDNTFLLDVREPYEFDNYNLGGTLIPLNSLANRVHELPTDKNIVVLCAKGIRSQSACEFLHSHNFKVFNLTGGLSKIKILE